MKITRVEALYLRQPEQKPCPQRPGGLAQRRFREFLRPRQIPAAKRQFRPQQGAVR